jgi:hypothetical protein
MSVADSTKSRVVTESRKIRESWSEAERQRRGKIAKVRRLMLLRLVASSAEQQVA